MKPGQVKPKTISILLALCLFGLGIIPPLSACSATCSMGPKMDGSMKKAGLSMEGVSRCCCCGQETTCCDMQMDLSHKVSDRIPLTSQRPEIPYSAAIATITTFTDPLLNSSYMLKGTEKTSGAGPPVPIFLLNLYLLR